MASSAETPTTALDRVTGAGSSEAQEEVLPDYENTPSYSPETFNSPLITYHLRATKKNTSHLVAFEPAINSSQPSYEIKYRSSTALPIFNRNGDISVLRTWSSSPDKGPAVIARADFHDKGPLPYCPRARITVNSSAEQGQDSTVEMQSRDWKNWTFNHESSPYVWTLRDIPACIELSSASSHEGESTPVIARFTYGKVGTKVLAGGEAGQLQIWRDALTESMEGREVAVVGCLVVAKYFEGLGRRYRNDGSGGSNAPALINAKGRESNKVRTKIMLF